MQSVYDFKYFTPRFEELVITREKQRHGLDQTFVMSLSRNVNWRPQMVDKCSTLITTNYTSFLFLSLFVKTDFASVKSSRWLKQSVVDERVFRGLFLLFKFGG